MAIEPTTLTNSDVEQFAWSPNGRWLAYVMDESTEFLLAFDADSVPAPVALTDPAAIPEPGSIHWAPDGEHLLAVERVVQTGMRQAVAYSSATLARTGVLGTAYDWGQSSSTPFSSGTAPVAFSPSGPEFLWQPRAGVGDPGQLLSASFDDPAAPAVNIVADIPMGTMPPIGQFWLRR